MNADSSPAKNIASPARNSHMPSAAIGIGSAGRSAFGVVVVMLIQAGVWDTPMARVTA